jgi:hypothetical protein
LERHEASEVKAYVLFSFSLGKDDADQKMLMFQQLVVRGTGRKPNPPRDLQSQPGSRGALLTWKLPSVGGEWIRGWRVYRETESNLYCEIQDPGNRQLYVDLTSGTTPPQSNFFISAIGAAGVESAKVGILVAALPEAGAPAIPPPPPGYSDENAGGRSPGYYRTGL